MKAPPFRDLSGKYLYIYKYCALVKRHEWQYRLSLCVVLYIVQFNTVLFFGLIRLFWKGVVLAPVRWAEITKTST